MCNPRQPIPYVSNSRMGGCGDLVNVRSIAEMGAYVNLLEYNNIKGMIMLSELSHRCICSINKLVRIGRNECVVVIRTSGQN